MFLNTSFSVEIRKSALFLLNVGLLRTQTEVLSAYTGFNLIQKARSMFAVFVRIGCRHNVFHLYLKQ